MRPAQEVFFDSDGVRCAADMYWPEDVEGSLPCVVMAHGGSGTKRLGLPNYAREFASHGVAVLVFDYRHFGESDGDPRQVIDVSEQQDDYRAAVRFARSCAGIDPDRIALWGTSLSGGHVLAVAATDPRIAAVVSQVPLIDGWHRGRTLRERLNRDVIWRTAQFTVAAIHDILRSRFGLQPYFVPVVAKPGQTAVFTEPEAMETFDALGGEAVGWRNALAPRMIFSLPRYRKGTAQRLSMPILMCLADQDQQASTRYAAHIASQIPFVEIHHYPVGHFGVYLGALRDEITATESEFLRRHLMTISAMAGT